MSVYRESPCVPKVANAALRWIGVMSGEKRRKFGAVGGEPGVGTWAPSSVALRSCGGFTGGACGALGVLWCLVAPKILPPSVPAAAIAAMIDEIAGTKVLTAYRLKPKPTIKTIYLLGTKGCIQPYHLSP